MAREGLYNEHARYYDLLYSFKNYEAETKEVMAIIDKHKTATGNTLLEVGCGTGRHLQYFRSYYQCTGIDLSEGMLDVAKQRLPDVELHQMDMAQLDLGQQYDVVSSLFSSIGYVTAHEDLVATINALAQHVKKGGVLVIEPWISPSAFTSGHIHLTTYDGADVKIARMGVSSIRDTNISVMNMHYMAAEKGIGVSNWVDRNELALYEIEDLVSLIKATGLKTYVEEATFTTRKLIIGVK